jgi:putative holliday junction resolvase
VAIPLQAGDPLLALDVGEARIGLARGEVGAAFVFGRGALQRSGRLADDVAAVAAAAAAERAVLLVVGLPVRAQGGDSAQTQRVRAFVAALRAAGHAVELLDERFTTALAQRQVATSGLSRGKRREKGRLDEAAAIAILETYLARRTAAGTASAEPTEDVEP